MLTENENQQQTNFIENQTKLVSLISSSSFLVSKLKNQENLIAPFNSLTILDIGLNMKYNDNLLSNKLIIPVLSKVTDQLSKLSSRISDTRSRVLVTGDLNAGKSTFINAILQRQIVPDDQQPCTAIFAEVIDANQNNCIEEVHGIMNPDLYMNENTDTFQRFEINQLREIVEVNENGFALLKVYCQDSREKTRSLLHNGIVDISLIDSPGLNIDSMKTTALFAQQDEIDVIVFVVNAENHFTLSVFKN